MLFQLAQHRLIDPPILNLSQNNQFLIDIDTRMKMYSDYYASFAFVGSKHYLILWEDSQSQLVIVCRSRFVRFGVWCSAGRYRQVGRGPHILQLSTTLSLQLTTRLFRQWRYQTTSRQALWIHFLYEPVIDVYCPYMSVIISVGRCRHSFHIGQSWAASIHIDMPVFMHYILQ